MSSLLFSSRALFLSIESVVVDGWVRLSAACACDALRFRLDVFFVFVVGGDVCYALEFLFLVFSFDVRDTLDVSFALCVCRLLFVDWVRR